MRILLAGASGLIGGAVARELERQGHEVRSLVRRTPTSDTQWQWNPATGDVPGAAISWADVVIALSGASLARLPWTARYRQRILHSRTDATRALATAMHASSEPPAVWVNASAVGI